MMSEDTISAVIVAKDEEEKIADCLESVNWVDEVLVIDTGSADKTPDIAKRMGAQVIRYSKGSYDSWRNKGLKEAKGDWILYIDADERVTATLRDEIIRLTNLPVPALPAGRRQAGISIHKVKNVAYAIPRKNIVLGKELKHGGFGEFDYVKRLFVRGYLKKWKGKVHEEPYFIHKGKLTTGRSEEIGHLQNKLLHLKAKTISEMIKKTNNWSEIEARLMYDAGHPPMNILRFFSAMFREFWFRFVLKRAFLDGDVGIIHGFYQVLSRSISYAKLWEMQEKNNK